jgi:Flp pilus assembly protein TadG
MRISGREHGQAYVVTLLFLTGLLGMAAMAVDVGSWYKAQRSLQAAVDAAALAGAQALPEDEAKARSLAADYLTKNGGGTATMDVTKTTVDDDTIKVSAEREAPGFFAKVVGIDTVDVHAKATARAAGIAQAKYVAPVVVNWQHPMLQCECFGPGNETTIELDKLHKPGSGNAAGSFALIDLRTDGNGNVGASELADWMLEGLNAFMPLGDYTAAPSANFNNSQFQDALADRTDTEVLFPIYKKITGSGSGAKYEIIGWVGFVPTAFNTTGSSSTVTGYFTQVTWQGIGATSGPPTFGAKIVALVE